MGGGFQLRWAALEMTSSLSSSLVKLRATSTPPTNPSPSLRYSADQPQAPEGRWGGEEGRWGGEKGRKGGGEGRWGGEEGDGEEGRADGNEGDGRMGRRRAGRGQEEDIKNDK